MISRFELLKCRMMIGNSDVLTARFGVSEYKKGLHEVVIISGSTVFFWSTQYNGTVLLAQLIDLYSLIVIGAVIISWLQLPPTNIATVFLRAMTEPVLTPIRQVLPSMNSLDFAPFVLLFALQFIRGLL